VNGKQTVVTTSAPGIGVFETCVIEAVFSFMLCTTVLVSHQIYGSKLCTGTLGHDVERVDLSQVLLFSAIHFVYIAAAGPFSGGNWNFFMLLSKAAISESQDANILLHGLVHFCGFAVSGFFVRWIVKPNVKNN
jgi:hypothetical protein